MSLDCSHLFTYLYMLAFTPFSVILGFLVSQKANPRSLIRGFVEQGASAAYPCWIQSLWESSGVVSLGFCFVISNAAKAWTFEFWRSIFPLWCDSCKLLTSQSRTLAIAGITFSGYGFWPPYEYFTGLRLSTEQTWTGHKETILTTICLQLSFTGEFGSYLLCMLGFLFCKSGSASNASLPGISLSPALEYFMFFDPRMDHSIVFGSGYLQTYDCLFYNLDHERLP